MLFCSLPFPVPHGAIALKPFSTEDLAASKGHVTGGCSWSWSNCRHAHNCPEVQQGLTPCWRGTHHFWSRRGNRSPERGDWMRYRRSTQSSGEAAELPFAPEPSAVRQWGTKNAYWCYLQLLILWTQHYAPCFIEALWHSAVREASFILTLLPTSFGKLGRSFNLSEWLFHL